MKQKTLVNFIKDHWSYSLIYFAIILCILLFYQVSTDGEAEIIYPLMIGIYGYIILIAIRSYKYFGFNKRISKSIHNPNYDLCPRTEEQREINAAIQIIHQQYIKELHQMKGENDAWRHFLSQWIHNLKTPISVIDLMTQKELHQLSEAQESMSSIAEENEKLTSSVNQLLSLIRLENFAKDYMPEQVDLKEELRLVINGMKNHFVLYHVFPELHILTEETTIFSDRKWHKLMLEQFISNAVKYSRRPKLREEGPSDQATGSCPEINQERYGEGSLDRASTGYREASLESRSEIDTDSSYKKVYITLEREEQGLRLTIRDEGIGIPEYDLNRIFEPFFTGDNGREIRNSTGIGLYIADTAARRLKHHIVVESAVGVGTTVTIHYSTKLMKP